MGLTLPYFAVIPLVLLVIFWGFDPQIPLLATGLVAGCLEWKHLKIRLAVVRAFLTTAQICSNIVSLLSVKMPKSRILETRLTLARLIT